MSGAAGQERAGAGLAEPVEPVEPRAGGRPGPDAPERNAGVAHTCLYRARIGHRRFVPKPHGFEVSTWFVYLDLSELEAAFAGRWLWSLERFNWVSFRRRDYLGPANRPLEEAVRDRVESNLGFRPAGPVRMLTTPRVLGLCFNPVSFYYCFEPDGETLAAVVSEITNTPWNERRAYVHDARALGGRGGPFEFEKDFHVSPFLDMDVDYAWVFSTPGERLSVHMDDLQRSPGRAGVAAGTRLFEASLAAERRAWSGAELARALLRWPLLPAKVLLVIYFQALVLFLKRVPFLSHPSKRQPAAAGDPR